MAEVDKIGMGRRNIALRHLALRAAQVGVSLSLVGFIVGSILRRDHPGQIPLLDLWAFNGVFALGAAVCFLRPSVGRPDRGAWWSLGVGLAIQTVGNVYYTVVLVHLATPPEPSLSAICSILWYPASYAGVVFLIRARSKRFLPSLWLDGLVAGLGVAAALVGTVVVARTKATGPMSASTVNLALPFADISLVVLIVAGVTLLGARLDRVLLLATAGLALGALSDLAWLVQNDDSTYVEGGLPDVILLVAVSLAILAASLPDSVRTTPRRGGNPQKARVEWGVLWLPGVAIVGSVLLLGLADSGAMPLSARLLAMACILAGVARVALTFHEVRDLADVHQQARTDDLTSLPNRRAFYERCDTLLASASGEASSALLLMDLDRFKEINDTLGHAAGDDLLVQVGRRVRLALRSGDTLARLGGDEFAVLLPLTTEATAVQLAHSVLATLTGGFDLGTVRVHIDASIGVSTVSPERHSRTELLRCADIAMYEAKAHHAGVMAYSSVDTTLSVDRLSTIEDLRRALRGDVEGAGRLLVHLQPQTSLIGGAFMGVEALVRWQHPTRGLLAPDTFLPAAETANLMGELTEVVLGVSLTACATWWARGHYVPVSVNVSAANVHDLTLPHKIAAALVAYGLPPQALVIELTENTLMADSVRARTVLDEIRAIGVGVSIDDYGTGYSSLSYLHSLSVDELKIDRAFTSNLGNDPVATSIVRHTIELAHALGLRLVAEGIEDQAALEILAALGCDIAQGFHIARPMPAADIVDWMDRQAAAVAQPSDAALTTDPASIQA